MKKAFLLVVSSLSIINPAISNDCNGVCAGTSPSIAAKFQTLITNVNNINQDNLEPPIEDQILANNLYKLKCTKRAYITDKGEPNRSSSFPSSQEKERLIKEEGVITFKKNFYDTNKSFFASEQKIRKSYEVTVSARSCQLLSVNDKAFKRNCENKLNKEFKKEFANLKGGLHVESYDTVAFKDGIAYYDFTLLEYESIEARDHGDMKILEVRSVAFDANSCKPINSFTRR